MDINTEKSLRHSCSSIFSKTASVSLTTQFYLHIYCSLMYVYLCVCVRLHVRVCVYALVSVRDGLYNMSYYRPGNGPPSRGIGDSETVWMAALQHSLSLKEHRTSLHLEVTIDTSSKSPFRWFMQSL